MLHPKQQGGMCGCSSTGYPSVSASLAERTGSAGTGAAASIGGNLFLPVRLLGHPQLIFHLHPEIVRRPAKLSHQLPKLPGQFRKFLRPEQQQRNNEDDGAILKARHTFCHDTGWPGLRQHAQAGWPGFVACDLSSCRRV